MRFGLKPLTCCAISLCLLGACVAPTGRSAGVHDGSGGHRSDLRHSRRTNRKGSPQPNAFSNLNHPLRRLVCNSLVAKFLRWRFCRSTRSCPRTCRCASLVASQIAYPRDLLQTAHPSPDFLPSACHSLVVSRSFRVPRRKSLRRRRTGFASVSWRPTSLRPRSLWTAFVTSLTQVRIHFARIAI